MNIKRNSKFRFKFKPAVGQAMRILICAIFRIEMSIDINSETIEIRENNEMPSM